MRRLATLALLLWCAAGCGPSSATACADVCAATLMQPAKAAACEAQEVDFFTCAYHDPDTAVYTCSDGALVPKSALCVTKKKALDACFAS